MGCLQVLSLFCVCSLSLQNLVLPKSLKHQFRLPCSSVYEISHFCLAPVLAPPLVLCTLNSAYQLLFYHMFVHKQVSVNASSSKTYFKTAFCHALNQIVMMILYYKELIHYINYGLQVEKLYASPDINDNVSRL